MSDYKETVGRAFEAMANAASQAYRDNSDILRKANEWQVSQTNPGETVPPRITSMKKMPADFQAQQVKVREEADSVIGDWAEKAKAAIRSAMVQPVPQDAQSVLTAWSTRPDISEDELRGLAEAYPDNLQVIQAVNSYAGKQGAGYRADHPALTAMGRIENARKYATACAHGCDADPYAKDAFESLNADMAAAASGDRPKSFLNAMGYQLDNHD